MSVQFLEILKSHIGDYEDHIFLDMIAGRLADTDVSEEPTVYKFMV
jgi:hypothetical protein